VAFAGGVVGGVELATPVVDVVGAVAAEAAFFAEDPQAAAASTTAAASTPARASLLTIILRSVMGTSRVFYDRREARD
jgi:hypothetical protein